MVGACHYNLSMSNERGMKKYLPFSSLIEQSDELEKMLYEDIQKQVKNFDFISCKEDNKEFIYTDKGILLKITYICEENIALQDKILLGA